MIARLDEILLQLDCEVKEWPGTTGGNRTAAREMAESAGEVTGWVGDDGARRRRELEMQRQLVGHRIKQVRYFELRYEGHAGPAWGAAKSDSLDHGLELDLDNETTCAIIWMQRGRNEALSFLKGRWSRDISELRQQLPSGT